MCLKYINIILREIKETLQDADEKAITELVEMITHSEKVFFVGVGRVLLSLEAIAKRLNHLGINTVVVGQITEPAITSKDLLIVVSGSGETGFPLFIASKAKSYGAKVAHIGTSKECSMKKYTDLFVKIPASNKKNSNEKKSVQPMTSLFEQSLLILGDAIAMTIIAKKHIDIPNLWQYHANLE